MGQSITTTAATPTTPGDRLSFTLFLAIAVHATLIFGLGFQQKPPSKPAPSLDVTLVYHQSDTTPTDADFVAQANQVGSGNIDEQKEVTTDQLSDFAQNAPDKIQKRKPTTLHVVDRQLQHQVVSTLGTSPKVINTRHETPTEARPLPVAKEEVLDEVSEEIASLQARLDAQRQAYAKRPRIRHLTSVSAMAHYEALYLDAFRRAVEEVGTRNFPRRALEQQKFGDVRLVVSLRPDGSVIDIEVSATSGHGFLDEAAVQSVRLAAPFAPFTEEMRKHTDILEIIRTWRYDRRQRLISR